MRATTDTSAMMGDAIAVSGFARDGAPRDATRLRETEREKRQKKMGPATPPRQTRVLGVSRCRLLRKSHYGKARTPSGIARGDRRGDAETRRFHGRNTCRKPRGIPRVRSYASLRREFARRAPARTHETPSRCATFPSRRPFRRPGQQRLTLAVARHGAHGRAAVRCERHPERVVETNDRVYSRFGAPAPDGVRARRRSDAVSSREPKYRAFIGRRSKSRNAAFR